MKVTISFPEEMEMISSLAIAKTTPSKGMQAKISWLAVLTAI
jgi:hypothetical protein